MHDISSGAVARSSREHKASVGDGLEISQSAKLSTLDMEDATEYCVATAAAAAAHRFQLFITGDPRRSKSVKAEQESEGKQVPRIHSPLKRRSSCSTMR